MVVNRSEHCLGHIACGKVVAQGTSISKITSYHVRFMALMLAEELEFCKLIRLMGLARKYSSSCGKYLEPPGYHDIKLQTEMAVLVTMP